MKHDDGRGRKKSFAAGGLDLLSPPPPLLPGLMGRSGKSGPFVALPPRLSHGKRLKEAPFFLLLLLHFSSSARTCFLEH